MTAGARISVGDDWQALGPFPSGTREYPMAGSPLAAFTSASAYKDPDVMFARLKYGDPVKWPSELCPDGYARWDTFKRKEGMIAIQYPMIKWEQLRSDRGWASLQYQSYVRGNILVQGPKNDDASIAVRFDVVQGTEYAFLPEELDHDTASTFGPLTWYQGDVYNFAGTSSGKPSSSPKGQSTASNMSRSILLKPGRYIMLIRAIYDIRMFGDPGNAKPPTILIEINAECDRTESLLDLVPEIDQVPSVISGWIMGDWMSIGVRVPEREDIQSVYVQCTDCRLLMGRSKNMAFTSESAFSVSQSSDWARIVTGQTRQLALRLKQTASLPSDVTGISIKLAFVDDEGHVGKSLIWTYSFDRVISGEGSTSTMSRFWTTFSSSTLFGGTGDHIPATISSALLVPPSRPLHTQSESQPVILALHGAGVDIKESNLHECLPDIPGIWAVIPTGRTEWGEDWHGGSMENAWAAREMATKVLKRVGVEVSDQTVIIGHSNGGQGAWHLAARYPDRVIGVVAAAGYLKIQDYVPYTEHTSSHYADPALMGILSAALAPYDNDLYASNLAHIPVLAVHGKEDDNVPPRHSRAHAALVNSWAGNVQSVIIHEVNKKGHWWDEVFNSLEVLTFIQTCCQGGANGKKGSWADQIKEGFTLTTANPQECGGRAGIRIVELDTPGRIARLDVNAKHWQDDHPNYPLDLRGMNIRRIEVKSSHDISAPPQIYIKSMGGQFAFLPPSMATSPPRAYGPTMRLLSSRESITIVVPNKAFSQHLSVAKRIAHDMFVYHRLDCTIIDSTSARGKMSRGNIIIIGRTDENEFCETMLAKKVIPLEFPTKGVMLIDNDRLIYDRGAGIITLLPHPVEASSLCALIAGNDATGLELAARLFPIRTGVPIPDWAVVGPRSRWQGAGGFIGAGFWSSEWEYNEATSWMDR